MSYDLMLLADPGPAREEVLRTLGSAPDVYPDPELDNRFWMRFPEGEAQINIGTKDPVESIHVELELGNLPLSDRVARRSLELAAALDMRLEDVQWGHEVDADNLSEAERFWKQLAERSAAPPPTPAPRRPWWRFLQP